jgi:hypothetical protein
MFGLHLRELCLPDPLHLLWNDTLNAAKAAGEYKTIVLCTLIANLAWGPWEGLKWHSSLKEASADMQVLAKWDDPVYAHLLPRMLRDAGFPVPPLAQPQFQFALC